MKNWQTRLKETVSFVQKSPAPPPVAASVKGQIAGELEHWNRTAPQQAKQTVSGLMSREGLAQRPGSADSRKIQRATIMINCAIIYPQTNWTEQTNFVNQAGGDPNSSYRDALGLAWDVVNNRQEVALANLNKLKSDPIGFLRMYKLWTDGAKVSSQQMYSFYMRKGLYRFGCRIPKPDALQVSAISVPATSWGTVKDNINAITATRSDLDQNCELVLTSQFSGCTYCFSIEGANYAAAHIDPQMNPDGSNDRLREGDQGYAVGTTISTSLQQGGFSNGNNGVFHAYGRVADPRDNVFPPSTSYGYGEGRTIILAVKRQGTWSVYAQQQDVDGVNFSAKKIST